LRALACGVTDEPQERQHADRRERRLRLVQEIQSARDKARREQI